MDDNGIFCNFSCSVRGPVVKKLSGFDLRNRKPVSLISQPEPLLHDDLFDLQIEFSSSFVVILSVIRLLLY